MKKELDYDPLATDEHEAQEKDLALTAEKERLQEESDIKWLMRNKTGRRIMRRNLERAGVYKPTFSTNALTMAYSEGLRNEGLYNTALIMSVCPELHTTMLNEAQNDRFD